MRRLMRILCNGKSSESNSGETRKRLSLRRASCFAALGGVLALAPAFAKDPATIEVGPAGKAAAAGVKAAEPVAIPQCLEKLKLTQPQQEQIKELVRSYDSDLATVWKQFSERYQQTIGTEVQLLAAIEDNLTEPQRKQVRDQRRKMAQHERAIAGTDLKPSQATGKPTSAVEEELAINGVSLTDEQEASADKVQEKYLNRLRSLNRDIQGLHTRLVSLEADKLVEIEKVLTKEQLAQLREIRQTAPVVAKVAAGRGAVTKTE